MLNPSLKELGLTAKNRNIKGYESMSKEKLLRIIINNKRDKRALLNQKKKKPEKAFVSQKQIVFLNLKVKKLKKVSTSQQKNLPKSKIKKIKKILYDSKINGNIKIEDIKNSSL